ncbi:MAG: hypothetical protein QM594_17090 [Niabella sp.]
MITSVEVFKHIKAWSLKTLNRRQRIILQELSTSLSVSGDSLLVLLIELENRGLIKIHRESIISVSLTNYGVEQHNPPGGIGSEEM